MVKETRIVFEAGDIRAIRVRCKKCENEVTIRTQCKQDVPLDCPMCNTSNWASGSGGSRLLSVLRAICAEEPEVGATVILEIDGEAR